MSDEKDEDYRPSYERLQRERRSRLPDLGEPAERDYDLSARAFQPNEHATLARLMLDKNLDEQSKLQLYADVLGLRGVPDSVKRLQVPSFGVNYTRRFAGGGNTQMSPFDRFRDRERMQQMGRYGRGLRTGPQPGIAGAFQGINPARAGYNLGNAGVMANRLQQQAGMGGLTAQQQQQAALANQQMLQQQMMQQYAQTQDPALKQQLQQQALLQHQQELKNNPAQFQNRQAAEDYSKFGLSPELIAARQAFDQQQQQAITDYQNRFANASPDQLMGLQKDFSEQMTQRAQQFEQQNPGFMQGMQAYGAKQQQLMNGMPGQLGGQSGGLQPQFDPMPMKVQLSPEQQQQIALLNQQNAPRLQQELQQRIQQKFFDTHTANQFGNQGAMGLQPLQAAGGVGFQPQSAMGFQPQQTQANLGGMGSAFGGGLQGQFQAGMGNQFGMQPTNAAMPAQGNPFGAAVQNKGTFGAF